MLNFDRERFLNIEASAVALAGPIHAAIGQCMAKGAKNIFFLGTGGAAILMQPAALLLQRRSGFPAFMDIAAELVAGGHQALGKDSIIVIPSLSGTTKESVAALDYCKDRGATILTLVGHADTPLGRKADHAFVNFAEDGTSSESFYLQSLLIALSAMAHRGEFADYERTVAELSALPQHLLAAKQAFEPEALRIAEAFRSEPWHIITAAGGCWAEAWYYGMCILEEMQWIRTRPVHAADFFHGTLELVGTDVSVVILKGEDAYRPLAGRVEAFARQYTGKVTVLDSARYEMPGISPETRALISPIILATILERLSAHLEVKRNHPLTTRRYYKKVSY
ncbi:MAG: SIS domain-containing protein [Aestuariivirga sp.]|uniref:SIS domain-containing protein n=1 Tax=Aestuariivirga sp. TaxID=2650926 RepID=UPI0025B8211B|nr:SIS domain-containing protein [Aestuariivirga sp.]MCA3562232.1 SIS domain-containing protein [Aestuariivirga sp.]